MSVSPSLAASLGTTARRTLASYADKAAAESLTLPHPAPVSPSATSPTPAQQEPTHSAAAAVVPTPAGKAATAAPRAAPKRDPPARGSKKYANIGPSPAIAATRRAGARKAPSPQAAQQPAPQQQQSAAPSKGVSRSSSTSALRPAAKRTAGRPTAAAAAAPSKATAAAARRDPIKASPAKPKTKSAPLVAVPEPEPEAEPDAEPEADRDSGPGSPLSVSTLESLEQPLPDMVQMRMGNWLLSGPTVSSGSGQAPPSSGNLSSTDDLSDDVLVRLIAALKHDSNATLLAQLSKLVARPAADDDAQLRREVAQQQHTVKQQLMQLDLKMEALSLQVSQVKAELDAARARSHHEINLLREVVGEESKRTSVIGEIAQHVRRDLDSAAAAIAYDMHELRAHLGLLPPDDGVPPPDLPPANLLPAEDVTQERERLKAQIQASRERLQGDISDIRTRISQSDDAAPELPPDIMELKQRVDHEAETDLPSDIAELKHRVKLEQQVHESPRSPLLEKIKAIKAKVQEEASRALSNPEWSPSAAPAEVPSAAPAEVPIPNHYRVTPPRRVAWSEDLEAVHELPAASTQHQDEVDGGGGGGGGGLRRTESFAPTEPEPDMLPEPMVPIVGPEMLRESVEQGEISRAVGLQYGVFAEAPN